METFIEAVKNNDLVSAKKAFAEIMSEKTKALVEAEKLVISKSIVIEGEEKDEKESSETKEDKKESDESDEDTKEKDDKEDE
ncbi:hypothetical protein [Providencia phage PSTRCR_127]|nr:hypothetical protein [Providencia phage PSTRCR_127]